MEKRAINILMLSVFMLLAVMLMPVRVSAETETDTAPTVMYKLINHDCIKLKWEEVTGADGYYIYRTDTGTGKTVKYKKYHIMKTLIMLTLITVLSSCSAVKVIMLIIIYL